MLDIYYNITSLFALLILFIINRSIYRDKERQDSSEFKWFIASIGLFLLVDGSWGLVQRYLNTQCLYADAVLYNIAMIFTVFTCCRYVSKFLESQNKKVKILNIFGSAFLALDIIMLIVNFFTPVLFWLDEEGAYHTGLAREIGMGILVAVSVMMTLVTFRAISGSEGSDRNKTTSIFCFSLLLVLTLLIQALFPSFPCYSYGLVVGIVIIYVRVHVADQTARLEKVTELNETLQESQKQLEKRKDELKVNIAASELKTKSLQNLGHEIRTPLNAMFGFSQLLGMPDGTWTDEEKDKYNGIVYNSFNMLEMLVNDILDGADAQHGNYRMEKAEFEVNEMCRNALMSVEFRRPGNVAFEFTTDLDDSHTILSDSRRLQQILVNYLTNACKNTARGKVHLHVTDKEIPGKIVFACMDTGRGVPVEKAEAIFGRYTKLDQNVQGSGLGLNICHIIATKLDAKVYLDTTYTGGARFILEIEDK